MAQRVLRALLQEKQNGGRRKETKRILQKVWKIKTDDATQICLQMSLKY